MNEEDPPELPMILDQPLPRHVRITVSVDTEKAPDVINVTEAVDPSFDLDLMLEAIVTKIIIAGKYTETPLPKMVKYVHNYLDESIKFHGKMISESK